MKLSVKTVGGRSFDVEVKPEDTVADLKNTIEISQGVDVYPAAQQMLIHSGTVLKDETTLDENKIGENSLVVVLLSKKRGSEGSSASTAPPAKAPRLTLSPSAPQVPVAARSEEPEPATTHAPPLSRASISSVPARSGYDINGQAAASSLVAISKMELHSQCNEAPPVEDALPAAKVSPSGQIQDATAQTTRLIEPTPTGPNVKPLDLFPQDRPSSCRGADGARAAQSTRPTEPTSTGPTASPLNLFPLDRPSSHGGADGARPVQSTRSTEPTSTGPNANALNLFPQDRPSSRRGADGTRATGAGILVNEPLEDRDRNLILLTPEERQAIARLVAMGFSHATAVEAFLACHKNEEQAANYLLDHIDEN